VGWWIDWLIILHTHALPLDTLSLTHSPHLTVDWTNTVSPAVSSEQFGEGEGGVMFRWDSGTDDSTNQVTTSYYVLEGMGCCFCPTGSDLYAWKASHPFGPWVRGPQLNTPRPGPPPAPPIPLMPNPTLGSGAICTNTGVVSTTAARGTAAAAGSGTGSATASDTSTKLCLQANSSSACVPIGGAFANCNVEYRPCTGGKDQQWRVTQLGEIQSALTSKVGQLMCLDGAHGVEGQLLYTNACVLSAQDTRPIGQLWRWDTTGAASTLTLDASGTCAAADRPVMTTACEAASASSFTFPKSTPLTPPPPTPAPLPGPNLTCHGCQVQSNNSILTTHYI
jgi:hypothetical protein